MDDHADSVDFLFTRQPWERHPVQSGRKWPSRVQQHLLWRRGLRYHGMHERYRLQLQRRRHRGRRQLRVQSEGDLPSQHDWSEHIKWRVCNGRRNL